MWEMAWRQVGNSNVGKGKRVISNTCRLKMREQKRGGSSFSSVFGRRYSSVSKTENFGCSISLPLRIGIIYKNATNGFSRFNKGGGL